MESIKNIENPTDSPVEILSVLENLLWTIRKDLGHKNIKEGKIFDLIINNFSKNYLGNDKTN